MCTKIDKKSMKQRGGGHISCAPTGGKVDLRPLGPVCVLGDGCADGTDAGIRWDGCWYWMERSADVVVIQVLALMKSVP